MSYYILSVLENMEMPMKVKSYTRLMRILRYAPLAVLAVSLLLKDWSYVEITGDRIPPGKDPSIF